MIQRASPWTAAEVAKATGGALVGPERSLQGVSTDTRDALAGCLFVALSGDRFDAHDFLGVAVSGGAAALLVSRAGLSRAQAAGFVAPPELALIVTDDTLRALGELGRAHRARRGLPLIALTGSNGKTTTKEMIAAIFSVSRSVLKTEGNLNNLIGVPMTVLGIGPEHDLAIVEMGMNQPGEIARYTEIARPDVGLVLNVGPAHIGMFGSLAGIARAKGELYAGLDRDRAIAVVNLDDPHVVRVAEEARVASTRTFGRDARADVRLVGYTPLFERTTEAAGGVASYLVDGAPLDVHLPIAGAHNAVNLAGAIAAATAPLRGASPATFDEIRTGIARLTRVGRRMVFERAGDLLVVDDCYNANTASMSAAFETVRARVGALGGRFVAVLGEMRELGERSEEEHRAVGEAAARSGAVVVAALGPLAAALAEAARAGGAEVRHEVADVEVLFDWLAPRLRSGDVVLVKGSRGMKMERFVERLRALGPRESA